MNIHRFIREKLLPILLLDIIFVVSFVMFNAVLLNLHMMNILRLTLNVTTIGILYFLVTTVFVNSMDGRQYFALSGKHFAVNMLLFYVLEILYVLGVVVAISLNSYVVYNIFLIVICFLTIIVLGFLLHFAVTLDLQEAVLSYTKSLIGNLFIVVGVIGLIFVLNELTPIIGNILLAPAIILMQYGLYNTVTLEKDNTEYEYWG